MWRLRLACMLTLIGVIVAMFWFFSHHSSHAMSLQNVATLSSYVHDRPPVGIVFTSRTAPVRFQAESIDADGFHYPGTNSWAAREGRLRLLDTDGNVYELTWDRCLPDGSKLIDVMSPSVSLDGRFILFAGRKAAPDPGRWRIYRVNVDGSGLEQLTGKPGDLGCVSLPPMRYGLSGVPMSDEERFKIDFDDIDPTDLGASGFAFVSSRLPDLGRDHSRRATQIWMWPTGEERPTAVTANRNNDRWPVLLNGNRIMFSLWSRNREVVTADRKDVRPVTELESYTTNPTDRWMAARVSIGGAEFGYAVKSVEPVWRARPLFNGRVAFMTDVSGTPGRYRLAQADWGYIRSSPSSLQPGADLPDTGGAKLLFGPNKTTEGHELTAMCPSPCPDDFIVFSGCEVERDPNRHGLYLVSDDWTTNIPAPRLIFDDPDYVDSEPVAVYHRDLIADSNPQPANALAKYKTPETLELTGKKEFRGPMGYLENLAIYDAIRSPIPWHAPSDQRIDPRRNPLIPPPTNIRSIAFYTSHRDRFDDPTRPRIPGGFEKLMTMPVNSIGELQAWLPANSQMPTILAGLDDKGSIAKWSGKANDSAGRPGTYYAFAGDHYSGTRTNGYHYCNGCHTGHTFTSLDTKERLK